MLKIALKCSDTFGDKNNLKTLSRIFQFVVIFPVNLISLLLNRVLLKRYDYICNGIILYKNNNL